ncbi:MAG: hypothetical protein O6831_06155 [Alphaproteobacteria bacterium]|nr:hypothetical protein [Alphaproteobacteria bacterium]
MVRQSQTAKRKASRRGGYPSPSPKGATAGHCDLPPVPERVFDPEVDPFRAQLIRVSDKKWVNGTVLHYYFFDRPSDGPNGSWVGPANQRTVVRRTFGEWKGLGIGLEFQEVANREEAEIRIGFDGAGGSWSYVGRDIIDHATDPNRRTMNFGWSLTTAYGRDTALHEIGHSLGFPHEHQNPNSGIIWNEPEVYDYFRGPPNNWDDSKIHWNILRKLPAGSVLGSRWDPDSIMHYGFGPGLIDQPAMYQGGLTPESGLSDVDIREVKTFYPPLGRRRDPELVPLESQRLKLAPGQQANFRIRPELTRRYTIQTFGTSDSVIVLFEDVGGTPRFVAGDDDSGYDRNARIETKLRRGKEYILRVRLYYSEAGGDMAVLAW